MGDVDWAYSSIRGPSLPYLHTGGFPPTTELRITIVYLHLNPGVDLDDSQTDDGAKWEFSLKTISEEPFWKLSGWGPHLEVASHVILSIGARAFLVVVLRCHLRADWQWCCAYRLGSGRLLSPCLKASLHPCLQFFRSFTLRLVLRRYRSTPLSLTPLGAVIATLNWCIGTLYIPASLDPTEHNKYAFLFERVDRFFTYAI